MAITVFEYARRHGDTDESFLQDIGKQYAKMLEFWGVPKGYILQYEDDALSSILMAKPIISETDDSATLSWVPHEDVIYMNFLMWAGVIQRRGEVDRVGA
jgi:hypothetical protein